MTERNSQDFPKIGYLYHYPKTDHPTEKFRLDIFVTSIQTEQHFDVLKAHYLIKNQEGIIEKLTVRHPWTYEESVRVCPGVVILEDRKGKKEEAFCFGGQLDIVAQENQTVCKLVSSAPILEISQAGVIPSLYIEELEILLAELRAKYAKSEEYENQLCQVDPYQFYLAGLDYLLNKIRPLQRKDENHQQLLYYLRSQKHRLVAAGLLKDSAPSLEDVFQGKS